MGRGRISEMDGEGGRERVREKENERGKEEENMADLQCTLS